MCCHDNFIGDGYLLVLGNARRTTGCILTVVGEEGRSCDKQIRQSDIIGMVDSLRQRKVHPTVLAAATLLKCDACQASARLSLRPVVSGRLAELLAVLQMDMFRWKHPHVRDAYKRNSVG